MRANEAQLQAITHKQGPAMILAGPGSGKTTVIVQRILHLIREENIPPQSILVITFSKAASIEMKERYEKAAGRIGNSPCFGTFHGVFFSILKEVYHLNGENILSDRDKRGILLDLVRRFGIATDDEKNLAEELEKEISLVKSNRISLEHYYSSSCAVEEFTRIYKGYCARCLSLHKLDFDDMLLYCHDLLSKHPKILKKWQEKFRYILVDEFQDVNLLQYDTIRLLAAPENHLFIVGDDDQSIYHFRGARPEIMRRFTQDYPDAARVLLDVNYRCTRRILSCAMSLIGHNKNRFDKALSTPNPVGNPVRLTLYPTPKEEHMQLINDLKAAMEAGEDLKNYCVLFRTNQEAQPLIHRLMDYHIPFYVRDQLPDIFQHFICQDILAYLRLAQGDMKRNDLLRIMNRPNRYISRDDLGTGPDPMENLRNNLKDKEWVWERVLLLKNHLRILKCLNPYAGINFIRKGIGYDEYLQDYARYRKINEDELTDILDQIMDSARDMKDLDAWEKYIHDYEEALDDQKRNRRDKDAETEGVRISTLHASKGLEFDHVYIMNLNEGSIPYRKARLDEAIEEERRLLYVGMTRARKTLKLAYVKTQYERAKEPSRFLGEIELDYEKE